MKNIFIILLLLYNLLVFFLFYFNVTLIILAFKENEIIKLIKNLLKKMNSSKNSIIYKHKKYKNNQFCKTLQKNQKNDFKQTNFQKVYLSSIHLFIVLSLY